MSIENQPQHVFIITKGPQVFATGVDQIERVHCGRTRQMFEAAIQTGEPLKFWFMPGWLCPNVRDFNNCLEIQPQLAIPIPFLIKILDLSEERGSEFGISLFAEVQNIFAYQTILSPNDDTRIIKARDRLDISYNINQGTGGFSVVDGLLFGEHTPPLINSRSELQREFVDRIGSHRHGGSVYKTGSISHDAPISNTLRLFTIEYLS